MTSAEPTELVLVVDRPGYPRDALVSLVQAAAGSPRVVTSDSAASGLEAARSLRPRLAVLGSGLPEDELLGLLRRIRQGDRPPACLVLSGGPGRKGSLDGLADRVLPGGLPADRILSVVEGLLRRPQPAEP